MKPLPKYQQPVELPPVGMCIDVDEYNAALRTSRAQALAKSLGVKLPYSLAKKYSCRCGRIFVLPKKFLAHRLECAVLIRDAQLLARQPKVVVVEATVEKKAKEGFPCRCGHVFPNKRMCTNHQKLCSVLKEAAALFARGKEYVDRNKETKTRKKKNAKAHTVSKVRRASTNIR